MEELVRNSDIICTTTPSTTPVLPDDKELLRGKCIIAIGSYMPEMREIPDAVLDLVDNVYIELPYACEEKRRSKPAPGKWKTYKRPGKTDAMNISYRGKKRSKKVRQHISNRLEWDY